jgi:hypothetical protein
VGAAVGVAVTCFCAIPVAIGEQHDVIGDMPDVLPVTASAGGILGLAWGVVAVIAMLWSKRHPNEDV